MESSSNYRAYTNYISGHYSRKALNVAQACFITTAALSIIAFIATCYIGLNITLIDPNALHKLSKYLLLSISISGLTGITSAIASHALNAALHIKKSKRIENPSNHSNHENL